MAVEHRTSNSEPQHQSGARGGAGRPTSREVRTRGYLLAAVGIGVFVLVLAWPAGTWLQCRSLWAQDGDGLSGAIYLVAGARDQDRRIDGLLRNLRCAETGGIGSAVILIGNDDKNNLWSSDSQRVMTRTERAVERLGGICDEYGIELAVVPGVHDGTDQEMLTLARYLAGRKTASSLTLVTSPYHVRRAIGRFERHSDGPTSLLVITADGRWTDRAPWVVGAELLKMVRDACCS